MRRVDTGTSRKKMSDGYVILKWDLPRDVLGDVFSVLPAKSVAICTSVAKAWREVVAERRGLQEKVALEKGWRCKEVEPRVVDLVKDDDGPTGRVLCGAMCGNRLAVGDKRSILIMDVNVRHEVLRLDVDVDQLAFLDEGSLFGIKHHKVLGWDLSKGGEVIFVSEIFDERDTINKLTAVACVGDNIVVGASNGLLQTKKKEGSWCLIGREPIGFGISVRSLSSARKGTLLVCTTSDWGVRVYDIVQWACMTEFNLQSYAPGASECPCTFVVNNIVACGTGEGMTFFGLNDGKMLDMTLRSAFFLRWGANENGSRAVSVNSLGFHSFVNVWNVWEGCECFRTLDVGSIDIYQIWVNDSSIFLLCSYPRQMMIYDFA